MTRKVINLHTGQVVGIFRPERTEDQIAFYEKAGYKVSELFDGDLVVEMPNALYKSIVDRGNGSDQEPIKE